MPAQASAALSHACLESVPVYYPWRPNLRDESDDHIVELAVAGGASIVITNNVAVFAGSDLRFPEIRIFDPKNLQMELA